MLGPVFKFRHLPAPARYFLAPMAGITDSVFRLLMREMGAEVVISELVSAEGLVRGGKRTRDLMAFCERERPVGIQLFGSEIPILVEAAKIVESCGADFVDLNFGCPVKKVVCDGGGAAWLKSLSKLGELLRSIRSAISVPLTIKVRTGWDENSLNARDVAKIAAQNGVAWMAIHGRTRSQGYSGRADWELIREVAQNSPMPIIGNGDVLTAEDALKKIRTGYAHGVMIGRGALKNPWIFKEIQGELVDQRDFLDLISRHFQLAIDMKDGTRAFLSLKKFLGWYASGHPYASWFRSRLFSTQDIEELREIAVEFFGGIDPSLRVHDAQPFLMGGHG